MNKKYMKKILLIGGGTGGHFFPALSIYSELIQKKYIVKKDIETNGTAVIKVIVPKLSQVLHHITILLI